MELNDLKGVRLVLQAVGTDAVREYDILEASPRPAAPAREFTLWAQRDPRWRDVKLGNSSSVTIGSDGCILCSLAGMLGITPAEANESLKNAGAFAPGSAMLSVATSPYFKAFGGRLRHIYQSQMFWRDMPTAELVKLKLHIAKGQPALLLVDSARADGLQTHYMLCDAVAVDVPVVQDSWFYETAPVTKRYSKAAGNSPVYRFDLFEVV
jgi:hypothetical protein